MTSPTLRRPAAGCAALALLGAVVAGLPAHAVGTARLLQFPGTYLAHFELSEDGRYVAYQTRPTPDDFDHAYVWDSKTGHTDQVDVTPAGKSANGPSATPSISADGRYVVFASRATDLVPGDTNEVRDAFLRDRVTRRTVRISMHTDGKQIDGPADSVRAGAISTDGRVALFSTDADVQRNGAVPNAGVIAWYAYDRISRRIRPVNASPTTHVFYSIGEPLSSAFSASGRYLAVMTTERLVPADTDTTGDVYRLDLATGAALLLSDAPVPAVAVAPPTVPSVADPDIAQRVTYSSPTIDASGQRVAYVENRTTDTGPSGTRVLVAAISRSAHVTYAPFAQTFVPTTNISPRGVSFAAIARSGTAVVFDVPQKDATALTDDWTTPDTTTPTTMYRAAVANHAARTALTAEGACPTCARIPWPPAKFTWVCAGRDASVLFVITDLRLSADDTDTKDNFYLVST